MPDTPSTRRIASSREGERTPHQRNQRGEEGKAEQRQHDLVRQLGQARPQAGHRYGNEQPGQAEQHPGARP